MDQWEHMLEKMALGTEFLGLAQDWVAVCDMGIA